MNVTIIPDPSAQEDEKTRDRLIRFERQLVPDDFDTQNFQDIFDEVCYESVSS